MQRDALERAGKAFAAPSVFKTTGPWLKAGCKWSNRWAYRTKSLRLRRRGSTGERSFKSVFPILKNFPSVRIGQMAVGKDGLSEASRNLIWKIGHLVVNLQDYSVRLKNGEKTFIG